MFTHYRTQGIILKRTDRGEADQLLTIYTRDFGKIEVLGRAIRKIGSKLRPGADLFQLSEIEFIQGKVYKTLTDAAAIENFHNIKKSLARLRTAFAVSDLITELMPPQEADPRTESIAYDTFRYLNSPEIRPDRFLLLYLYFFWNFMVQLGYAPEIHNCVICQNKLTPRGMCFSSKHGGVICGLCLPKIHRESRIEVAPETVKVLRIITQKSWPVAARIKIEPEQRRILQSVTEDYRSYIFRSVGAT